MKKRVQAWAKRNPLRTAIVFDLVMIATTAVYALVALGPDSLLDKHCSTLRRSCLHSHGVAVFWGIASGALTIFFLGLTVWSVKTGRFKKQKDE